MTDSRRLAELIRAGTRDRLLGNAIEAERSLREAVAIAEEYFPDDAVKRATALNSLGLVCKDLAKYDEAHALYERALSLVDTRSDANAHEIATLYHNLGGIEHARRNYADGEVFARRGLEIRARLDDEPALAADMVALAAILDGQEKFDEAEPLYLEALEILERSPETHAGEIAVALNDLGALYTQRGASERAEALLTRAVDLKRQTIGPRHPDVAVTLNNLAIVHKRRGDVARAAALYRDALGIFESALGADHPKTVACRRNYDHCAASESRS
jgi:tetratricopeptide (TPR) repeat protein